MDFGVLGPLGVTGVDGPLDPGPGRRRAILAALLCEPNRNVTAECLIDAAWGENPPRTAAKNVQVHVYHLRRLFGEPDRITYRFAGYSLRAAPEEIDAARFERLLAAGEEALGAGDPDQAERCLTEALALWRGPAFADLAHSGTVAREARRLDELRIVAQEVRTDARLRAGRLRNLIPELFAQLDAHPYRERVAGQLMTALYRDGRQSEALAVFHRVRRTLAEELGVDPGAELRDRYAEIVRGAGTHVSTVDEDVEAHQLAPAPVADDPLRETLDWLVAAAATADRTLTVTRLERMPVADTQTVVPPELYRPAGARRWLDHEAGNLYSALRTAFDRGWHNPAWRLAFGMYSLFRLRCDWEGWCAAYERAVDAATRAGVPAAVAPLRVGLARAYAGAGRADLAVVELTAALSAARGSGGRRAELAAVCELARLALDADDLDRAQALLDQARQVALVEPAAGAEAAAWLLRLRGELALRRGDPVRAGDDLEQALATALSIGDGPGTVAALCGIAEARRHTGDRGGAAGYARQALAVALACRDVSAEQLARTQWDRCATSQQADPSPGYHADTR